MLNGNFPELSTINEKVCLMMEGVGAGHLCRAGAGAAGTIVQYGPGQKPHLLSIDTGPPQAPPGAW